MELERRTIQINPILTILVIIQLLFIIFIVIAVSNILNDQNNVAKVDIDDYSDISSGIVIDSTNDLDADTDFALDDTKKSVIGGILYDVVSLNNIDNIQNNKATIRQNSVHYAYIDDLQIYFLNFIVDLEDLGQSYHIVYRWADEYPNENVPTNEPAIAFCPQEHELTYGDFGCKDNYDGDAQSLVVYDLLRYKEFSDFTVGLSGDVYNGEALKLRINTTSDEDSVKSAAIEEVSGYLTELGFNLNDFEYTVGSYICCSLD